MANGNGDESPRATTASVDRRVERLEESVHGLELSHNELDRKVDRIELGQAHLKEILDAKFNLIQSNSTTLSLQVEKVLGKIESIDKTLTENTITGQAYLNNPTASPAGQMMMNEIKEQGEEISGSLKSLDDGRINNANRIEALEKRFFIAMGAVGFGMFLFNPVFNVFIPLIREMIGIK